MGNVLDLVYNNYLTTYQPRTLTRYETHKKSELRGITNSIVKSGKDTPWYLQPSKETQNYAIKLKEDARELGSTIFEIGGDSDEVLGKKVAYSSDPSVASARFVGDNESATGEFHTVEVRNLAERQENMGIFLPDGEVRLPEDMYSFNVAIDGMNYEFQFSIDEGETNRGVQERLAKLINGSNTGIKADILENGSRSALHVVSEQSGLSKGNLIFEISDDHTGKRNGAVEYFGLDFVSRQPKDAEVLVDGESIKSRFNEVNIGGQYEVKLNSVSAPGQVVEVGLRSDLESVAINIEKLIDGFNGFLDKATGNTDASFMGGKIGRELRAVSELFREPMERVGIDTDENGKLAMDRGKFIDYAKGSENLREDMSFLKDYSSALLRKSNQISLNPMEYVHKTVVAYKNPGHSFVSAYNSSVYAGMIFNGYC